MEEQQNIQIKPVAGGIVKKFPLPRGFQGIKGIIVPSLVIVAVMLAGVVTGAFLSNRVKVGQKSEIAAPGAEVKSGEVGIEDPQTFRDSTEGVLEAGGIDGEGTHHLVRDGGPSQYAYLTSSVVDLDQFVGKRVQVWGQTFSGQKAGWLMDVGRVKILD